jgi:hypothetical protein
MTFTWKWSYQNECGYRFDRGEIEVHRENERFGLRDYQRRIFNGDDEAFQRNVLDSIGGAIARMSDGPNRWTPALYEAFSEYWKQRHADACASLQAMQLRHPDVTFDAVEPFIIPRPIYWNNERNRFENEPFYEAQGARQ